MIDVIVIGGGPCGLSVGAALQKQGIHYLILEKGAIVNSILSFPVNMRFYSTSDRLEIADIPFLSEEERPSRSEVLRYYRSVVMRQKLNILTFHHVTEVVRLLNHFRIVCSDHQGQERVYEARQLVFATGIYDQPRLLGVPGEQLPKVKHYYSEGHSYAGRAVLVAGGKNSAIEAAIDLYRSGAEVTLVHRGPTVYQGIKPTLLLDIRNMIEKGRILFYPEAAVTAIDETSVYVQRGDNLIKVPNEFVFSLIGYRPDVALLQQLGIELDAETQVPKFNSDTFETNVPNAFVAGVVTGGITNKVFIDDGRLHGFNIARALAASIH
ncbi:YpdA family putative bacillithiol disulfide reductase [Paenibacillus whitsoniae]|uniref:YpdA family putative bacillithiol disulfide reductase n=1 Tax=Paenibacillus whitsoniae TaxID=2496558 RepID=A0A3S0C7C7_9BACL|nr:YpdA family putative bacillithiol disulfide reductase [Paenibacillus whitsoniae]RTE07179.1 YpdA family putative bacillithiol disulfide reductase [Paenibacillus whitsoniae]